MTPMQHSTGGPAPTTRVTRADAQVPTSTSAYSAPTAADSLITLNLATRKATASNATLDQQPNSVLRDTSGEADEEMLDVPKRASFMGLPPELRLRIYSYLFTRVALPSDSKHCCCVPLDDSYLGQDHVEYSICCSDCSTMQPQMLQVSRAVRDEVRPVFYGTTELRLVLPVYQPDIPDLEHNLNKLLAIPSDGRQFVRNALFVSDITTIAIDTGNKEAVTDQFAIFWNKISSHLPNLRDVRIHLDTSLYFDLNCFAYQEFNPLVSLSKIESIELEVGSIDYDDDPTPQDAEELQGRLARSLRNEAQRIGKKISVIDTGHRHV